MSSPAPAFSLRKVIIPVYLPTFLFTTGEGAIIPVIPTIAHDLHANLALAGLVAGMFAFGILVGDLPSGWIVSRVGERVAMIWAAIATLLGIALCTFALHWAMLGLGMFIIGLATSVFALARHAFLTTFVPLSWRARSLSMLGGMFRAGMVIGPLLSAGLIAATHDPRSSFWLFALFILLTAAVLIFIPDPERTFGEAAKFKGTDGRMLTSGEEEAEEETHGLFRTIWTFRGVLIRLGTGSAIVGALRATRTVIIPLWAITLGLQSSETALIVGVASMIDFALFYTSGQIMDRWGRLWSAIPAMVIMSTALIILAFSRSFADPVTWLWLCAIIFSLGNGVGSGILLTFGSDLAPPENPAPFLGAFRFTSDFGGGVAPMVISGITAAASLAIASGVIGVVGFFGAFLFIRYVPRYITHYKGVRRSNA